jgi:hypothetical protein
LFPFNGVNWDPSVSNFLSKGIILIFKVNYYFIINISFI